MTNVQSPPRPAAENSSVVIAVPTYRRPQLLQALLTSLQEDLADSRWAATHRVLLVVADNDRQHSAEPVVTAAAIGVPVRYVPAPEPGISQVRNELIRAAYRWAPDFAWIVMLDDDGRVVSPWLDPLLAGAAAHEADVAAGPVLGDLPAGASLLARNSVYAGRARYATGPVAMLNGAQNIAIHRRVCDRLQDPWFDPALGRSGGEDYHFFRGLAVAHARLVWVDEAVVSEPTPAERLRWRPLLTRTFRSNALAASSDVQLIGRAKVLTDVRYGIGSMTRDVAAALVRRDIDRLARAGLLAVSLAGRASGLLPRDRTARSHGVV